MRNGVRGLAVAGVVSAVVLSGTAVHAHEGSGGHLNKSAKRFLADEHHLDPVRRNVELVGKVKLSNVTPGRVSDVGVHGNYAYLGDFVTGKCPSRGVWIVNIADPAHPREVKYLQTGRDSYVGEGVQAIHLSTPQYTGDVLVMSAERCEDNAGSGGATLVDVTNPEKATPILSYFGDWSPLPAEQTAKSASGKVVSGGALAGPGRSDAAGSGRRNRLGKPGSATTPATTPAQAKPGRRTAHNSHSVFLWTAGEKAYAVLVDSAERGADIFDISNPRKPRRIAEYDLPKQFPRIMQKPDELAEGLQSVTFHDVVVKEIHGRQIMLVSNWDAGYVKLDVTDPRHPAYLADNDFAKVDPELKKQRHTRHKPEGNAHEAEFTLDNRYIIAADEDFTPALASATIDGTPFDLVTVGKPFYGDIKPVPVYAGDACPGHAVPPAPKDGRKYVAVIEDGTCDLQVKHNRLVAAGGYTAALVVEGLACSWGTYDLVGDTTPMLELGRAIVLPLFGYDTANETLPNCDAGEGPKYAQIKPGAQGKAFRLAGYFDGWGYVHLFDNGDRKSVV